MKALLLISLFLLSQPILALKPPVGIIPDVEDWNAWTKNSDISEGYINALVLSESPYLKQHANNPINWTTLPLPENGDKLLFISIGYASCHWCHQMNKHTFMSERVAKILNEHYISVKVDRDEYPVFDYHYLQIQQAVLGEGGWPISIIALPDGSPVWVGSFADANEMINTATRFARIWAVQPGMLLSQAENIKSISTLPPIGSKQNSFRDHFLSTRDKQNAGKEGKVKFPDEGELLYMLSHLSNEHGRTDQSIKKNLISHLDTLAQSPLFDGVNGGFYRYATQPDWSIPHFEKMLYNQAQLLAIYSEAYQKLGNPLYKQVAIRIFEFLQTNMLREDGLYKTSVNADWQGKEGGYYLWDKSELNTIGVNNHISAVGEKWQYHGIDKQPSLLKLQNHRENPDVDSRGITGLNGLVLWALTKAEGIGISNARTAANRLANTLMNERIKSSGDIYRICYQKQECMKAEIDDIAYITLGLSAYSHLDTKLKTLAEKLYDQNLENISTSNRYTLEDHESISPLSAIVMAASLLEKPLTFNLLSIPEEIASASYIGAKFLYMKNYSLSYFAQDQGIILVMDSISDSKIHLLLNEGWHVNSSKPLQDYLIPTKLTGVNAQVDYPEGNSLKMSFSDELLSLYEGVVTININNFSIKKGSDPKLKLQACNDRLCLPPENINLKK